MRFLIAALLTVGVLQEPRDSARQVLGAASAEAAMVRTDRAGASQTALFAFGSDVRWSAKGGEAVCCYVMDDGVSMVGAINTADGLRIADPRSGALGSYTGSGVCWSVPDKAVLQRVPNFDNVYGAPGRRTSYCDAPVEGAGRTQLRPFCDDNADCAGNCVTPTNTTDLKKKGGAAVLCHGDTTGVIVTWELY